MRCLDRRSAGLTWFELVVGLLVLAALGVLALVVMKRTAGADARLRHGGALRAAHQALMLYGLDNGRRLPGLSADGSPFIGDPTLRWRMLTDAGLTTHEQLVMPGDGDATRVSSFAMLEIDQGAGRRAEWNLDADVRAVLLSDRNVAAAGAAPASLLSNGGPWAGWVVRGDGSLASPASETPSTVWLESPRFDTTYEGVEHANDALFEAIGGDDAWLLGE